jgi:hypothetical protein
MCSRSTGTRIHRSPHRRGAEILDGARARKEPTRTGGAGR